MDIKKFYDTFVGSNKPAVKTLDLENTFEVEVIFHPSVKPKKEESPEAKKEGVAGAAQASTTALGQKTNELGLTEKKPSGSGGAIGQKNDGADGTKSVFGYIAKGMNLSKNGWALNLTPFVQNMTIPNMISQGSEDIQTILGQFSTSGYVVEPDQRYLTMDILNTRLPIIDTIFYPWMRETTQLNWCYKTQPYTTATITANLRDHADVKYVFYGCFPSRIQTMDPSMSLNQEFTRTVDIKFQYMVIKSGMKTFFGKKKKENPVGTGLNELGMKAKI